MKWFPRDGKQPPKNTQILVFSPCYAEGDSMRFRTLDSQFFCLATDATHWTLLEAPADSVRPCPDCGYLECDGEHPTKVSED